MTDTWRPYADGTSGHQGDTSEAAEPDRRKNISTAVEAVRKWGAVGLTWRELAAQQGWHHGQASGALSNAHRSGLLVRLAETRMRCGIYVVPEYVNDREIRVHRSHPKPDDSDAARFRLMEAQISNLQERVLRLEQR